MQIRDRIVEFCRVPAGQLRPHPRNWRTHGTAQREALRGVLAEIGYAGALLARRLPEGDLQLIDGHLRAEVSAESLVPVLVLDVNDEETLKLLATLDPLAAMAGTDAQTLADLVAEVETDNDAVRAMLDGLLAAEPLEDVETAEADDPILPTRYQVVVDCADEAQQQAVFERLRGEGLKCRVLML